MIQKTKKSKSLKGNFFTKVRTILKRDSLGIIIYKIYYVLFRKVIYLFLIKNISFLKPIYKTRFNESPITLQNLFWQKILGINRDCYWPVHFTSRVVGSKNVFVGIDAAPGISPGCYIQALGKITIDDYTQIAPNVGIISSNHFMLDIRKHILNEVRIGKYCRIGMGSIILPGVVLGDFTTVAAGSIVSNSFPKGYCVIAGNPAILVEDYSDKEALKMKFIRYQNEYEYNGYIPAHQFEEFRRKHLKV